jgi:Na+/melibiose symporter-like transporter
MGFLFKKEKKYYWINWIIDIILAIAFIWFSFQVREMMLSCRKSSTVPNFSNFSINQTQTFCKELGCYIDKNISNESIGE